MTKTRNKLKIMGLILALVMVLGMIPMLSFTAFAADATITASGECGAEGSNLQWTLDDSGTLTISGTGAMADYSGLNDQPWYRNLKNITALVIGENVTNIGVGAFKNIPGLETVTFAEGSQLTTIGINAFINCPALKEITLPASVTSVYQTAFNSCTALTDIHVAEGNIAYKDIDGVLYTADGTTLVRYPLGKIAESITTPNGVTTVGQGAFSFNKNIKSITLSEGVTTIGDYAFQSCTALTEITLPAGLTSVSSEAFDACTALTDIHVAEGGSAYKSIDGVLYTADGKSLVCYPRGKTAESFTTPNGVTTIGQDAFYYNDNIKSIALSEGVTTIGNTAFLFCKSLTTVSIPGSVTGIGNDAFYGCNTLTTVNVHGNWDGSLYTFADTVTVNVTNHTFVDNVCTECKEPEFKIDGQQLNIGGDLSMKYYVKTLEAVDDSKLTMQFIFNGVVTEVNATAVENEDNTYYFTLTGIKPQCMGDNIYATLFYEGIEVAKHGYDEKYSVEINLNNLLEKYPDDAALVALINDTLAYGEAAEEYIGHNSMKPEQPYVGSHREIPTATLPSSDVISGYTVRFGMMNFIKIRWTDASVVKITIDGVEAEMIVNGDFKEAVSKGIAATDFDETIEFKVYGANDALLETFSLSINEYLYGISQSSENAKMVELAKALYNYGVSAVEYAASKTN